ncbi:YihY/virulence factor BrkB family protein [Tellurirhabdus bombi]|uniref:YihY/virulence factor BrkB family protein n=1 Tax=Tellurirhabdus bombi TaxID=2907205 RepID=UPI001F488EB8|nr:YihY/virulence factor BrkB family protein [Tellurirhabdus bombi]
MFEQVMGLKFMQRFRLGLQNNKAFDSKLNWYDFLNRFIAKFLDNDTNERSTSVAYSLILAVFPFIIFLFTLIPYIPIDNLEDQVMEFMRQVLPATTYDTVKHTVLDIISRPRQGVLSFGFILAGYAATSGMVSLMAAFNSSHTSKESRGFFKTRLIAVGLTLTLVISLFLAIAILVVGGVISDYLRQFRIFDNPVFYTLIDLGRYVVVFIVFVLAIAILYRFGPDANMKWKLITPGSILASVLIVITTLGFSYYVSNFSSYNKLYGSIGTLIVLMVWINLVCLLLILGFEMNVSLYNHEEEMLPKVNSKPASVT